MWRCDGDELVLRRKEGDGEWGRRGNWKVLRFGGRLTHPLDHSCAVLSSSLVPLPSAVSYHLTALCLLHLLFLAPRGG